MIWLALVAQVIAEKFVDHRRRILEDAVFALATAFIFVAAIVFVLAYQRVTP